MTHNPAIVVKNLAKTYQIYDRPIARLKQMLWRNKRSFFREFVALNNVSFEIGRGEVLGIVGRNGSGKSTLLQLICGTLTASDGSVAVDGRISALLELGSGFNPEFSGRENIYLNASILGLTKAQIDEKYDSIVEFSGIKGHIEQPVKTYSSGMYVRLAFAVAVATEPDILIVDEALAVGDEIFQRKCFAHFEKLVARGSTILFVSHSAGLITKICDRALLLDAGELLLDSGPKQVINYYHKLIYAPDDKTEGVKAEIREANLHGVPDEITEDDLPDVISFHADMKPESTIRNENSGVHMGELKMFSKRGERVNVIKRGDKYRFSYEVTFENDASDVRFNVRVRSTQGAFLAGANTTALDKKLKQVKAGETYTAEFAFECRLLQGVYYVEIGCSSANDGERKPLARVTDASMFKVITEPDLNMGGLVDLGLKPTIKRHK
jgi:lipopolysaccharide transport system ATP-binding protein